MIYSFRPLTVILIVLTDDGEASSESEVIPGQLPLQQDSAVSLPASLFERFDDHENIGIYFTIYKSPTLFPVGRKNTDRKVPGKQTEVGSQVVGINVDTSQDLVDLEEPIIIVLRPVNLMVITSLILIELVQYSCIPAHS